MGGTWNTPGNIINAYDILINVLNENLGEDNTVSILALVFGSLCCILNCFFFQLQKILISGDHIWKYLIYALDYRLKLQKH